MRATGRRRRTLLAASASTASVAAACADREVGPRPPAGIAFDSSAIVAPVGVEEIVRLPSVPRGPGVVRWTSDAPGVARLDTVVSAGEPALVRTVGYGTTHLRATVRTGATLTHASVRVHVVTVSRVDCLLLVGVARIDVNAPFAVTPALVRLAPGATAALRTVAFCTTPWDTLATWRSSDTTVATVSAAGVVTARRAGITAVVASRGDTPSFADTSTVIVAAPR